MKGDDSRSPLVFHGADAMCISGEALYSQRYERDDSVDELSTNLNSMEGIEVTNAWWNMMQHFAVCFVNLTVKQLLGPDQTDVCSM